MCPTLGCAYRIPPRGTWTAAPQAWGWLLVAGVMPVVWLAINEALVARFDTVTMIEGKRGCFPARASPAALFFSPGVLRCLYPLVAWSIVAGWFALHGRRRPWITVGVLGGTVLSVATVVSALLVPAPAVVTHSLVVLWVYAWLLRRAGLRTTSLALVGAQAPCYLAALMVWSGLKDWHQ